MHRSDAHSMSNQEPETYLKNRSAKCCGGGGGDTCAASGLNQNTKILAMACNHLHVSEGVKCNYVCWVGDGALALSELGSPDT